MSLLLDKNLSQKLVVRLANEFPGLTHVTYHQLDEAPDIQIWRFAAAQGLAIVTFDRDFAELSFVNGSPPPVIWLRCGNSSTSKIASLLRIHRRAIQDFLTSQERVLEIIG